MGKYVVNYEDWPKENIKELGVLLNDLMTTLDQVCANDDEEASWLRKFETDLDKLINTQQSQPTIDDKK